MRVHSSCFPSGKRILDIHHGGRVVLTLHYWPWVRRLQFKRFCSASGARFWDFGPIEIIRHTRNRGG
jgi:hypothetical protein